MRRIEKKFQLSERNVQAVKLTGLLGRKYCSLSQTEIESLSEVLTFLLGMHREARKEICVIQIISFFHVLLSSNNWLFGIKNVDSL